MPLHYRIRMTTPDFVRASALPRRLGLWSAVAVLVGSTIGSGIFRSPAGIADKLPGPVPFLSVWVIGGLFALCGALTLAEVAGAFPQTGGVYVFIRESWGRLPAFLFGWSELLIIRAAALGAISTTSPSISCASRIDPVSRRTSTTSITCRGASPYRCVQLRRNEVGMLGRPDDAPQTGAL